MIFADAVRDRELEAIPHAESHNDPTPVASTLPALQFVGTSFADASILDLASNCRFSGRVWKMLSSPFEHLRRNNLRYSPCIIFPLRQPRCE